jgi:hypothetical protein
MNDLLLIFVMPADQQFCTVLLPGALPFPWGIRPPGHGIPAEAEHLRNADHRPLRLDTQYLCADPRALSPAHQLHRRDCWYRPVHRNGHQEVSPALFRALGIFCRVTTNCAILGLAIFATNRGYGLIEGLVFALGAGCGFTLALMLLAGLRQETELATVPQLVRGTALNLIIAGILSMAFMGFSGLFTAA